MLDMCPSARQNSRRSKRILAMAIFFCLMASAGVLLYLAIHHLWNKSTAPGYMAGVAAVFSVLLQEAAFVVRFRQLRGSYEDKRNLALKHRLDRTISLVVLLGIVGAMTGEVLNNEPLTALDDIAALAATVMLVYKLIGLFLNHFAQVEESSLPNTDHTRYLETALRVYGVITVDQLSVDRLGDFLHLHLRISVDPQISIQEAQEIGNRVKVLLLTRFSHLQEVEIEVTPYDPGYPYKSNQQRNELTESTLLQ